MGYLAITVDVESDSAAFADTKRKTFRGVSQGLPKLIEFFEDRDYPSTLFVSCDVLHELDFKLVMYPKIEIASHGYNHTFPPDYMKTLPDSELKRNIVKSKTVLSKTLKANVMGFRAHALTVTPKIMNEISKHYFYDSSIITHRKYNGNKLKSNRPYNPSSDCMVKQGDLPIIEVPVSSRDLRFFKLPFIGSWIKWFPTFFFLGVSDPLIVMNLHCQDPIKFRHWKFLFTENYFAKLEKIISDYHERGYEIRLMREIAEEFHKVSYVRSTTE